MLKRVIIISLLLSSLFTVSRAQDEQEILPTVYSNGLKYCEGTVAYKGMILVSNFGTETLNPLNTEGKGYIMAIDGAMIKTFIPADGNLSAPKGMAVHDGHLFIADVNKVVIYNLKRLQEKPITITLPKGNNFVNDIVVVGNMVLVSVTDSGNLYGLDASDLATIAYRKPIMLGHVPGPNGMAVYENNLYIASYNPTGNPTADNVIYLADISNPSAPMKKLIPSLPGGQYDGIAVSEDGNKLVFTSWETTQNKAASVWVYNLTTKAAPYSIDYGVTFSGPASITIKSGNLWVPDLPQSKIYRFDF